jgi:predicted naringenin-chalcone synthase
VTIEELVDHYAVRYADHDRIDDALKIMRKTSVETRWLSRPLAELTSPDTTMDNRISRQRDDAVELAEQAAIEAMATASVDPDDIGVLVCVTAGGHTMPGIDILLIERLGLPRTIRRMPLTQLGCAGGTYAIARVAEQLAGIPGHALVVCADLLSPYIHPADTGMDAMIFRGLIGDAVAAAVVRNDDTMPGLSIVGTWDYTVPNTTHIVGSHIQEDGMHLHNSPGLYDAVGAALPHLLDWFGDTPAFLYGHPGGPRIMDTIIGGTGIAPALLDLSRRSLTELGNNGSASVLDVIRRAFDDPPTHTRLGAILSVGPGVMVVACKATWHGSPVPVRATPETVPEVVAITVAADSEPEVVAVTAPKSEPEFGDGVGGDVVLAAERPAGAEPMPEDPEDKPEDTVDQHIADWAAEVLALSPEEIDPDLPLSVAGLDSVLAVRLRARMKKELRLHLPTRHYLGRLSLADLTRLAHPVTAEP